MNRLTTLSPLLNRLFTEGAAGDQAFRQEVSKRPADERAAFLAKAKTDYAGFYEAAKTLSLSVSRETATLLYMLARATKARTIVEFGTSFGVSTLHLAAALEDNGGGTVIGSEFIPSKAAIARENLAAAGLSHRVEIREGDALETLSRDLPESIDLVLLDGAKVLYPKVLALLEPKLAAGALLVADNADDSPEYLAHVRDKARGYLSVPFAGDVELSIRLGAA